MLMHRASSYLSIALLWESMDAPERAVAIVLCVVVLALIAALATVLVKSGKRKGAKRPPEAEAQRQPPPFPPQPAPIKATPSPAPAESAYEKTELIHEPPAALDVYEKTVAVVFRSAIETTFQISGTAGVMEQVLPVSDDFVIGRKADASLQLNDPSVSQRHAKLSAVDGMLQVQDMGSTNGIYLGGQKIEGVRPLRSGDTLRIGTIDIRVLYTPTV